ncbi:Intraflagellar transport protein 46 -like protein [Trichinella sp. T9]|nr:Intraflagellar transport protein 46 -like protein [Trichinella sp. T9]
MHLQCLTVAYLSPAVAEQRIQRIISGIQYYCRMESVTKLDENIESITDAENHPEEIDRWIQNVTSLRHSKAQAAKFRSLEPMPDIEALMQEWPPEFEQLLSKKKLHTVGFSLSLEEYADFVCAVFDIPVYEGSRIQSLLVLFTLFSEFNNNQHFKAMTNREGTENHDLHAESSAIPDTLIL